MFFLLDQVSFWPQTLTDWGTVLAGFGTVFSAIAVIYAIKQFLAQKEEQEIRLRPWLGLYKVTSQIYKDRDGNDILNALITIKNYGESTAINVTKYSRIFLVGKNDINAIKETANTFRYDIEKDSKRMGIAVAKLGNILPNQELITLCQIPKDIYNATVLRDRKNTINMFGDNIYMIVLVEYAFARTNKKDQFEAILEFGLEGEVSQII